LPLPSLRPIPGQVTANLMAAASDLLPVR
jgi:hypothetical protein